MQTHRGKRVIRGANEWHKAVEQLELDCRDGQLVKQGSNDPEIKRVESVLDSEASKSVSPSTVGARCVDPSWR